MPPLLSTLKVAAPLEHEKTYYLKLCKLVIEVGRPVLQDVFDAIHPEANLPSALSTPQIRKKLFKLQQKNLLYQSQMDILYPSSGGVTSAKFDISLLIILLRNICSISSPKSAVWKSQPLPTDKSKAADIVRIGQCRNDLYHRTNLALTEGDFDKKWDEIKDALIRLGGGTKYEEDIQNIKVGSVDPEMEQHYHELLKSREEAEAQQAEDIKYMKRGLEGVEKDIKDMKQTLTNSGSCVMIDIKTTFRLASAGVLTIGWAAGCTYFLNRYKDDPEIVTGLVQRAIIPGTLAMGATVVGILRGSILIKVKVTSLQALDYLWKSCGEGKIEQNLHKIIVTDELIQQAPIGTDCVGISVAMSEDKYQTARDILLVDCCGNMKSLGKRGSKNVEFPQKRMRTNDRIKQSSTDNSIFKVGEIILKRYCEGERNQHLQKFRLNDEHIRDIRLIFNCIDSFKILDDDDEVTSTKKLQNIARVQALLYAMISARSLTSAGQKENSLLSFVLRSAEKFMLSNVLADVTGIWKDMKKIESLLKRFELYKGMMIICSKKPQTPSRELRQLGEKIKELPNQGGKLGSENCDQCQIIKQPRFCFDADGFSSVQLAEQEMREILKKEEVDVKDSGKKVV